MARLTRPLGALLLLALILLPAGEALAAAGGGSGGFGGGGGGGGGGFGGGGGSGSGGGGAGGSIFLGLVVVVVLFIFISGAIASIRFNRRKKERERQVRLAAAEATEDDAAFDPDTLVPAAAQLFTDIQAAWTNGDRAKLGTMVGPDLMVEWDRRLADFARKEWKNTVELKQPPVVTYVSLRNREADGEDRACVLIEAHLRDFVVDKYGNTVTHDDTTSTSVDLTEYWTLCKSDAGGWMLLSIEQLAEGEHNLDDELVASPWSDSRVRDEAVMETAAADGLPEGFTPADLADLDFDGTARAAALDLSVADARFAPDVLEAAARRAVEAWAEAVDGDDAALEAIADPAAVTALLYAGDRSERTRLVVRGPRVKRIAIQRLDAGADPAAMTISVELGGRRYVENRDTADVVSGSKDRATTFEERWTLTLSGPQDRPWRLAATGAQATAA